MRSFFFLCLFQAICLFSKGLYWVPCAGQAPYPSQHLLACRWAAGEVGQEEVPTLTWFSLKPLEAVLSKGNMLRNLKFSNNYTFKKVKSGCILMVSIIYLI